MKIACKDNNLQYKNSPKNSGESTIFRWHGDLKKCPLLAELASKPGRPESVMNDHNVNAACEVLQENQLITCKEVAALTNVSKTSITQLSKIQQVTASPCLF